MPYALVAQRRVTSCASGKLSVTIIRRLAWSLQIVRSPYIRDNALHFQTGKSHKDILWTVNLAIGNARFYLPDIKDYTYRINAASITHRPDYYDVRAHSYIDVIAEIIRLAELKSNKAVRLFLYRHALRETRHFLGFVP